MAGRKLGKMFQNINSPTLRKRLAYDFGKNVSSPFARLDWDDFFSVGIGVRSLHLTSDRLGPPLSKFNKVRLVTELELLL